MRFLTFILFLLITNIVVAQNEDSFRKMLDINYRMEKYDFQYTCLEDTKKANPDSVLELYVNPISCDDSFSKFPLEVLKFKNLKILIIKQPINSLPDNIYLLKNLEVLIIWGDFIKKVPKNLGKLEKLNYLGLSYNKLKVVPKSIQNLRNLEVLNFSNNRIKNTPEFLKDMPKLKIILLSKNPCCE